MLAVVDPLNYSKHMSGGKLATKSIILGFYALALIGTIQMYEFVDEHILGQFREIYSTVASDEFQNSLIEN
jgi:hypothetical protein